MPSSAFTIAVTHAFIEAIALPTFILECRDDGLIVFQKLNKAHTDAVGIPSEQVEGKTPRECFPERVAATILKNYKTCRDEKRSHCYEEVLKLNDEEIWWETTLSPLFDPANPDKVSGIVGIASDITARKTKEFRAAKAYSDLQKMNEDVALFSSMTAHDVRGPLAKINMLTELTLDGFEDLGDDKRQSIELVQKIAGQALGYVEDILGYAKALKTHPARPIAFGLEHLCSDIAALVDPEAKLMIVRPDASVECESVVLQMIVRNLVENASRHANSRIEISVDTAPDADGVLLFAIADDGNGFPDGAEGFERRIRIQQIESGNRGFALAAVAHLVETRDGKVWLDKPRFESGSTICFTLPGKLVGEDETSDLPDAQRMEEHAPQSVALNAVAQEISPEAIDTSNR